MTNFVKIADFYQYWEQVFINYCEERVNHLIFFVRLLPIFLLLQLLLAMWMIVRWSIYWCVHHVLVRTTQYSIANIRTTSCTLDTPCHAMPYHTIWIDHTSHAHIHVFFEKQAEASSRKVKQSRFCDFHLVNRAAMITHIKLFLMTIFLCSVFLPFLHPIPLLHLLAFLYRIYVCVGMIEWHTGIWCSCACAYMRMRVWEELVVSF